MKPKISILLPSYNHAEYISACLDSIKRQSFTDWEVIAIDDGSTDDSFKILSQLADPRIRVEQNEANLGTYGTLRKALGKSNAPYVAVMNSDNVWDSKKLEKQIKLLEDAPELPLVYTLGSRIDENGAAYGQDDIHLNWPREPIQELLPYLLGENRVLASSVVFRRERADFKPELRYSGDWAALLGPAKHAPFGCIPESLTFWRMHSHNSFRRSAGQVSEEVWVRESILADCSAWEIPRLLRRDVRRGLGLCAMHLAALYVLQGRSLEARQAARVSVRIHPCRATVRRLGLVSMGPEIARRRLWESEPVLAFEPHKAPLEL